MPSKSKTKGNKFENDTVKLLNEIYNTEEFSRTPNSGAMMGRSNWGKNQGLAENVKRTLGADIIVPDDFKFAVECKHYKEVGINAKGVVNMFYKQRKRGTQNAKMQTTKR